MRQAKLDDVNELKRVLLEDFGVEAVGVERIDQGIDVHARKWKVLGIGGENFFAKVKSTREGGLRVLSKVSGQVREGIIAPIIANNGLLPWGGEGEFWVHLFPFVHGRNGLEDPLNAQMVSQVGKILRAVHNTKIEGLFKREFGYYFEVPYLEELQNTWGWLETECLKEGRAEPLLKVFHKHEKILTHAISRATEIAERLNHNSPPFVLCHTDVHAGNILVGEDGAVYIIDWDSIQMSPCERDLMFFMDGGIFGHEPWFEDAFFEGYGSVTIDTEILAFCRYARALEDISLFTMDVLDSLTDESYAISCEYLEKQFLPQALLQSAYEIDCKS